MEASRSRQKGGQLHEGRLLVLELAVVVAEQGEKVEGEGGYFLHWLTKYGHREVRETPERRPATGQHMF